MFNFDYITKEDIKEHNSNWPEIPDHPYRLLIIGGSGSRKTNALLNLINHEPDTDKYEAKYQLLINKRISTGLKHFNDSKAFLNTQMIWMLFIKILKNTIQIKNKKY